LNNHSYGTRVPTHYALTWIYLSKFSVFNIKQIYSDMRRETRISKGMLTR
jgi:hypothetical protein